MFAIVGGSGFEKFDGFEVVELLDTETPFGPASSGLKKVKVGNVECLFLSRHGAHHELNPSEVNYRANIYALKKHGAKRILSISAVGSLKAELAPGDCVVCTNYIDRTKGIRKHTFTGNGIVAHISLAHPVCPSTTAAVSALQAAANAGLDFNIHTGHRTYVCIEGPCFSTYSECCANCSQQIDVVGMTNFPEYALAREAGLCYNSFAFVTDYDCWDTSRPHVTVAEVMRVMRGNNEKAFKLVNALLHHGTFAPCECAQSGIGSGLMTAPDSIPAESRPWFNLLAKAV